jgi:hypothetical protein
MARNTNTKSAAVVIAVEGDSLSWEFNQAALDRFGKGEGMRTNIGTAYLIGSKADREALVTFFGKGAVRRGLLVLAKGRSTNEADSKAAKDLAESLRTLTAKKVVKAAAAKPAKVTKKASAKTAA